jgi:hypothetical protein
MGESVILRPKNMREKAQFQCYSASRVELFMDSHAGRQGIAVLAFELSASDLHTVFSSYQKKYAKLLVTLDIVEWESGRLFEAYASYLPDSNESDRGTMVRFLSSTSGGDLLLKKIPVPGMTPVEKYVDGFSAYSDHWVSNLFDRKKFLGTMNDTLEN